MFEYVSPKGEVKDDDKTAAAKKVGAALAKAAARIMLGATVADLRRVAAVVAAP